jgi:hypothetical protein
MTITNGYCTLTQLKAVLRVTDTVDDVLFESRIDEASRVIDDYCNRRFFADSAASSRIFIANESTTVFVDDISTTTGLVVKTDSAGDGTYATTLTATDFQVEPLNAVSRAVPITKISVTASATFPTATAPAGVQVTAKWGWPAIPTPIQSACVILAGRLVKRGDSLLGVAGFGDLGAITVRSIDPDVQRMLAPYRLLVVA